MKIAYIISVYKYAEQLIRLVHRLNSETTSFFIHVDKKTNDKIYHQMVGSLRCLTNVHFLPRHKCYWGDFGHVRISLKAIVALCHARVPFDYAILLTGQDYPIKSNREIEAFFHKNKGKLFLDYFPLPSDSWENGGLERLQFWHWRLFHRHFVLPPKRFPIRRSFPNDFKPFGGSSYWCLSKQCVEYIYHFVENNERFVRFFQHVDVPDEIFFQTVILNSPLADKVVNDDLRYIDWKDPHAGSPGILVKADFEKLASSPKLFARKFDMTVDAEVLDMIDRQLLGQVSWRKEEALSFQDVRTDTVCGVRMRECSVPRNDDRHIP